MLANSLIIGLISYTVSVIYNLLTSRSLEVVFYTGIRFLFTFTFMTLFIQLSYFLIKDFNQEVKQQELEEVEEVEDKEDQNSENKEAVEQSEENKNQDEEFTASAIDNQFEAESFSAFESENFDIQQNNN